MHINYQGCVEHKHICCPNPSIFVDSATIDIQRLLLHSNFGTKNIIIVCKRMFIDFLHFFFCAEI